MDDPWGSPWASAENSGTPAPSSAADRPQPPPPALTNIPSLSLPSIAEPSPWADTGLNNGSDRLGNGFDGVGGADDFDDSGFGAWATVTTTGGGNSGGGWPSGGLDNGSRVGLSGFGASESPDRHRRLSPLPQAKTANTNTTASSPFFPGDASPIAWPSPTASRSPSRAPTRSPATSISAKRAPSIDSWPGVVATPLSGSPDFVRDERRGRRDLPPPRLILNTSTEPLGKSSGQLRSVSPQPEATLPATSSSSPSDGRHRDEDDRTAAAGGAATEDDDDEDNEKDDANEDEINRGPSQGSPITSVDEDTTEAREATGKKKDDHGGGSSSSPEPRPPLQRKISMPKVQELVVLFDGLSASRPASRRPSPSPSRRVDQDDGENDDDDFADFEDPIPDAQAEAIPPVPQPEDGVAVSPEASADFASRRKDDDDGGEAPTTPKRLTPSSPSATSPPAQAVSPATRGQTSAAKEPTVLSVAELLGRYGPLEPYTPPEATIDALFDAEGALQEMTTPGKRPKLDDSDKANDPSLDAYVPDHILVDSFTAISERRTWYRISRSGSVRRHRATTDDDNYRPITWATSTAVRPDTVRIVRRWMEEDAFTGRPTLGGGRRVFSSSSGSHDDGGGGGGSGSGGNSSSDRRGIGGGRGHLFGWDSTAAPVTLDTVYRKKKLARPISMGTPPTTAVVLGPTATEEAGSRGHRTVPAMLRHSVQFTADTGRRSLSSLASPLTPPSATVSSASAWALPTFHGSKTIGKEIDPMEDNGENDDDDGDDGDDWGEMVSSPTTGNGFAAAVAMTTALPPAPALPIDAHPPPTKRPQALPPAIPLAVASLPPPAATTAADVDRAVEDVLRGLPDLSYMEK